MSRVFKYLYEQETKEYAITLEYKINGGIDIIADDKIKNLLNVQETEAEVILNINIPWCIKLKLTREVENNLIGTASDSLKKRNVVNITPESKIQSIFMCFLNDNLIINGRMLYIYFYGYYGYYHSIIINTPSLPKLVVGCSKIIDLELYNQSEDTNIINWAKTDDEQVTNKFITYDSKTYKTITIIDDNTFIREAVIESQQFDRRVKKIRTHANALL